MDMPALSVLIELAKVLGLPGVILVIWYFSEKSNTRALQSYREDIAEVQAENKAEIKELIASNKEDMLKTHADGQREMAQIVAAQRDELSRVLRQYQADMADQREMYRNNAELVRQVISLASDQKDLIVMNTRGFTQLIDDVRGNQYCPMVRLKKKAEGSQES